MMDVKTFYDQEGGEKLVHKSYFPLEIEEYLCEESKVISRTVQKNGYKGILEVGCMNARLLEKAVELDVSYIGIDIVERYINQALKRTERSDQRVFVCDVLDVKQISLKINLDKYLVVFPFNSFGNLAEAEKAIEAVSNVGLDLLILTYGTDSHSNRVRKEYYSACRYSSLEKQCDGQGVVFTSKEGLKSYAYYNETIVSMCVNHGYNIITRECFSRLGKNYLIEKSPVNHLFCEKDI